MYIFTCENTFEDMMCCIYHAWEKALKVGHGCVRLEKRGEEQISLFDEYIYVEYNEEEYKKVVRSIKHKISEEAYACVYYACLSSEQDALDTAYRFLIKGFKIGSDITFMRNDPDVMRIKDIRRKVLHETRYFTDYDMSVLAKTEDVNDEYTDMWKIFFETIAIKHRYNPECQRNLMPVWMRKHVTEFQ